MHVKAILTYNTAFLPIIILVMFQAALQCVNPSANIINHCLAVLWKFLGILGKRYLFLMDTCRLN